MLNKELLMAGVGEVYADDPFKYLYDKYKWGVGSEYLLWFFMFPSYFKNDLGIYVHRVMDSDGDDASSKVNTYTYSERVSGIDYWLIIYATKMDRMYGLLGRQHSGLKIMFMWISIIL